MTDTTTLEREAPLSCNQEFLRIFDTGAGGPFGDRYYIVHAWTLDGPLPDADLARLQRAFDVAVERHATFTTELVLDEAPRQRLAEAPPVRLRVVDHEGPVDLERLLCRFEAAPLPLEVLPHLAVELHRTRAADGRPRGILLVKVHHTAADGWSVRIFMRDVFTAYAAIRTSGSPDDPSPAADALPPVASYADFAREQSEHDYSEHTAWWAQNLAGARIWAPPTGHPRGSARPDATGVHRFSIRRDVATGVLATARNHRCTPFMVLFAALVEYIRASEGIDDVTAPTFSPGRPASRYDETVGSFFNFLPIRVRAEGIAAVSGNDEQRAERFAALLAKVRRECLDAYAHDIPAMHIFGAAPELMAPAASPTNAPVVFQAFPFPHVLDGQQVCDWRVTEVIRRTTGQAEGAGVPDGALWTVNLLPGASPEGAEAAGSVQYKQALYDRSDIRRLVDGYLEMLERCVL